MTPSDQSSSSPPVPAEDTREWRLARKETVTAGTTLSTVVGPPLRADEVLVPESRLVAADTRIAELERINEFDRMVPVEELREDLERQRTRSREAEAELDHLRAGLRRLRGAAREAAGVLQRDGDPIYAERLLTNALADGALSPREDA